MLPDAVITIFVMIGENKSDPCQKSDDHSRLVFFSVKDPILRSKVPSTMIIRVTIVEWDQLCVFSHFAKNDRKKGLESH